MKSIKIITEYETSVIDVDKIDHFCIRSTITERGKRKFSLAIYTANTYHVSADFSAGEDSQEVDALIKEIEKFLEPHNFGQLVIAFGKWTEEVTPASADVYFRISGDSMIKVSDSIQQYNDGHYRITLKGILESDSDTAICNAAKALFETETHISADKIDYWVIEERRPAECKEVHIITTVKKY